MSNFNIYVFFPWELMKSHSILHQWFSAIFPVPPTRAEPLWYLVIYYPAYSTFSPVATESRGVTIVKYNLTSSKDEKDSDQTYVYSSSKLSPLTASQFLFEPPAEEDQSDHSEQNSVLVLESDSASDEAGPSTSASKTNTPVRQCVKWLGNHC